MTPQVVELTGERRATYEAIGQGPPLLMFPGGPGGNAAFIRPHAELFADRITTYLIDPPGSGGSTPPASPAGYGFEGHARFYDEVRHALGLERVGVYGFSFGGGVALAYAALFPDSTDRCFSVSFGGSGKGADVPDQRERALSRHAGASWYAGARAALDGLSEVVLAAKEGAEIDGMFKEMLPLYFAWPDAPDIRPRIERLRRMSRLNAAALHAWEGGLHRPTDVDPLLAQITVPTVVVAGEFDFACTPAQARRIAAAVPTSHLITIPGCGHNPAEEAPERLREAVTTA